MANVEVGDEDIELALTPALFSAREGGALVVIFGFLF
jgi:hypothetical protein